MASGYYSASDCISYFTSNPNSLQEFLKGRRIYDFGWNERDESLYRAVIMADKSYVGAYVVDVIHTSEYSGGTHYQFRMVNGDLCNIVLPCLSGYQMNTSTSPYVSGTQISPTKSSPKESSKKVVDKFALALKKVYWNYVTKHKEFPNF